jgi:hypothetical protein
MSIKQLLIRLIKIISIKILLKIQILFKKQSMMIRGLGFLFMYSLLIDYVVKKFFIKLMA